jgi:DNA-binding NarL/FixJ family response regulator/class 3 adenylate cyclase
MPELPTGTVTFVFTDVEGSTKLVRDLGDSYVGVISDHRRLVREALAERNGYEVDARGDEFFLAFQSPDDALGTAIAIQERHDSHDWPGPPVRVRIGIHTGEPSIEDDDYVGIDVHTVARLCAAGHGGQILLSKATMEALEDVEVKDLGEHVLRGLDAPERIFQLVLVDGGGDFPPLRLGLSVDAQAEPVGGAGPAKDEECVRVALAEDGVLLREGIARLLTDAGFDVVGQSGTAEDLLLKVRSYSPHVAVVDIRMPPTQTDEGLRAAQEIRAKHPDVGVLVLSQHVEPTYAMELLADNAEGVGYLLKDRVADVDEFLAAVRRVAEGGSALDPSLVTELVGRRRERDPVDNLTPREHEVLELMAEGRSNQAIGELLFVTPRAVEKHITNIFAKLGLPPAPEDHRRVLAVLAFLKN